VRSRVASAREKLTVANVSGSVDLAVKFATIVVAFGAIAVVFFGASVELTTTHQNFIDPGTLTASYAAVGETVPPLVEGVVTKYNEVNEIDLAVGENRTGDLLPPAELCRDHESLILELFPRSVCSGKDPVIGRGGYWERVLVKRAAAAEGTDRAVEPAVLRVAIERVRDAHYVRVRATIDNTGHARARDVTVRVPRGFIAPSDQAIVGPITLEPDDPLEVREYQSDPAGDGTAVSRAAEDDPVGAPISRFAVNWERDDAAQTNVVIYVAIVFAALWLFIVVNGAFGTRPDEAPVKPSQGRRRKP